MDISQVWKNTNPHIAKMSQQFEFQDIEKELGERFIKSQFKIISFMTQTEKHLQVLYKNPGQFAYNRYSTIMTFDHSRVILGDPNDKENPENYINANLVEINGKKVIATQGPLNNTILNFWRMMEEYKVHMIFMLCNRLQNNEHKCDLYWPTMQCQGQKLSVGTYTIKLKHQHKHDGLFTRQFDQRDGKSVTQYQLANWPDNKKPPSEAENHLQVLLQKMINCLKNGQIPLVHCSAGVGRTGTFITMAILKERIDQEEKISIFESVRKLREQRWGMVYTPSQYEYIYQFVAKLKNKNNII